MCRSLFSCVISRHSRVSKAFVFCARCFSLHKTARSGPARSGVGASAQFAFNAPAAEIIITFSSLLGRNGEFVLGVRGYGVNFNLNRICIVM